MLNEVELKKRNEKKKRKEKKKESKTREMSELRSSWIIQGAGKGGITRSEKRQPFHMQVDTGLDVERGPSGPFCH